MEPFGKLRVDLSPSDLRETAYEILIGACRSSGSAKRLTYVSNSNSKERSQLSPSPSMQRSLSISTASKLGRRIESMVLPLELLQQFRSSDFTSQQEYDAWQKRNLKVLEAGLLVHPHLPPDKSQTAPERLRQILYATSEKPIDTGKHSESMHVLRNVVTSLACRSFDGSVSDMCHWADGIPLNLHLYKILLESCFDVNDEASVIEEVDEVLDQIKKTWGVLGINQVFHNLCFLWVLFHQYIITGETQDDLLVAADHMMGEVEKDASSTHEPGYSKILSSALSLVLDWAEKKLQRYHDNFYRSNIDLMQCVLSLGVSAAKILVDICHEYGKKSKEVDVACDRVESYIRSSEREKVIPSRKSCKKQQSPLPLLSILAQNICDLAFNEKEIYSPVLKRWHPLATGVAVATLHACYAKELKKFVSGISELNPEAIQVLLAAEKLEKDLVEMAVADSLDSEDGGKSTIQEMAPYEAQAVITNFVKSWIRTRVDRLGDWVDRSLQQEDWNPQVNKGRFAPSAVEVLRIMDETLEAFFLLPIPAHPVLLPELVAGCTAGSKFSAFKRKDRLLMSPSRKSQVSNRNGDNSFSLPRLCLRINTLYHIRKELEALEKRTMSNLRKSGYANDENVAIGIFGLSVASCMEGLRQLSEATAYKIVFHDLRHVLIDYLYVGETSSSRIEPFLQELERNLEVISVTVHDRVRTRVITDVMKASFEGFMLVLLAGGPARAFSLQDAPILEEDFKFLSDLFWSNGDGLPVDMINQLSPTVKVVLSFFQTGTEKLIEQLKQVTQVSFNGASPKSRLPLPPTTGQWGPTDANTIVRVLCNRNDKMASNFLKKAYDLPKNT
ncbi:hypothetical protein DH2020_014470 [Rehmannia glutinosa]|uniref:Uncharacterized protein n=1 Tax=Rehmannia glutinosa TaxID=99300 RepID=A0ABR0WX75_REHGL